MLSHCVTQHSPKAGEVSPNLLMPQDREDAGGILAQDDPRCYPGDPPCASSSLTHPSVSSNQQVQATKKMP